MCFASRDYVSNYDVRTLNVLEYVNYVCRVNFYITMIHSIVEVYQCIACLYSTYICSNIQSSSLVRETHCVDDDNLLISLSIFLCYLSLLSTIFYWCIVVVVLFLLLL